MSSYLFHVILAVHFDALQIPAGMLEFRQIPPEWNWTPLELAWIPVEFKHSYRNGTGIQIFSAFTKSYFEIHLHRIYFFFLSYNLVTICIIVFISSDKQLIPYADNLMNSFLHSDLNT